MWLRMKNLNILGVHWKIRILVRGFTKKQYREGDCPKRGAWTICKFKRGLGKKEGVVFLRGVDTPMHTMTTSIFVSISMKQFSKSINWKLTTWNREIFLSLTIKTYMLFSIIYLSCSNLLFIALKFKFPKTSLLELLIFRVLTELGRLYRMFSSVMKTLVTHGASHVPGNAGFDLPYEVPSWKFILSQPYFGWIKMETYSPTNFTSPGQYIPHSHWKKIYCVKLPFLRPNQHFLVRIQQYLQ